MQKINKQSTYFSGSQHQFMSICYNFFINIYQLILISIFRSFYILLKIKGYLMMQSTNRKFFMDDEIQQQEVNRSKNVSILVSRMSILCLTTFYFGYCLVYISPLSVKTLVDIYGSVMNQPIALGFLIGILTLGAALGSAIAIPLIPMVSRRKLVLILCLYSLVVEGIIQTPNIIALFVCRFFQGIAIGLFMALIPTYIGELAPKQLAQKGIFGIFATLFVIIGVMSAFSLNIVLAKSQLQEQIRWRIVFAVNFFSILTTTVCILIGMIPESPNSLIKQKKEDQARAVIALFHRRKYVQQVYRQKLAQVQKSAVQKSSVVPDRQGRRVFLAFEIPMMQQLTGINAFVSQMGYVATDYNVGFGEFVPVIMGIVQFISAIYAMTCLARTQRRTMILAGNFGMALCSIAIGITYQYKKDFIAGFWVVIFFIFLFMTIHGGTLIPAVWVYVPQISRGNQPQYSSITNWLMCSATIIVYPIVNASYGYGPMFLFFGVFSVFTSVLNYFIMFESKTKQEIKKQINQDDLQLKSN